MVVVRTCEARPPVVALSVVLKIFVISIKVNFLQNSKKNVASA
jgi:hypothetical protein